jgi:hypothetical protein
MFGFSVKVRGFDSFLLIPAFVNPRQTRLLKYASLLNTRLHAKALQIPQTAFISPFVYSQQISFFDLTATLNTHSSTNTRSATNQILVGTSTSQSPRDKLAARPKYDSHYS